MRSAHLPNALASPSEATAGRFTRSRARIDAIQAVHDERLALILELSSSPTSVYELTLALFPDTGGYHELLALEEAAAHVEYLHARGLLCLSNIDALDPERDVKLTYVRCECLDGLGSVPGGSLVGMRGQRSEATADTVLGGPHVWF